MLLTKTVINKWHHVNREWYIFKGYKYTKQFDKFEVNVEDLSIGSDAKVEVKCDCPNCENVKIMTWKVYLKCVKEDGKYYCHKCALKLYGGENTRRTKLLKSKSFEQWCIENDRQDVLNRWDYEKNIDKNMNIIKPSDIGFSSTGFNKKGYWFKCDKHSEHKSELKSISRFTSGQEGSIRCNQCNSFAQYLIDTYGENAFELYWDHEKNTADPWNVSYGSGNKVWIKCQNKNKYYHDSYKIKCSDFTNGTRCPFCDNRKVHPLDSLGKLLEDKGLLYLWSEKNNKSPYEYAPSTNQKVWWKCPDGIHEDYERVLNNAKKYNYRCPECQFSKGEKRIEEYLVIHNMEYIAQHEYEGLIGVGGGNLSYDFYLSQYNTLIEYQGEFHDGSARMITKKDFEKQVEHDRRKKEYAENNKINLLPIWYWDFDNIEEILDRELNKKFKEVI